MQIISLCSFVKIQLCEVAEGIEGTGLVRIVLFFTAASLFGVH